MSADLPGAASKVGLGRSLAFVYSANAVNGILGVIAVPLGIHYLGAAGYGLFSIYSVLASYIALVDLGVTKNFVRILAADKASDIRRKHLSTALGLYLNISAALLLLLPLACYVVTHWLFPVPVENQTALNWIVAFAIIEYVLAVPSVIRQMLTVADERFDLLSLYNLLSGVSRFILMFSGFILFQRPEVAVLFVVSRRAVDYLIARKFLKAAPHGVRPSINLREQYAFLCYSSILSVAQLFQSTSVALGSILANRYLGLASLGSYRAAFDLANKVWFFSNGVGSVLFPRFARLQADASDRKQLPLRFAAILNASWGGYSLVALAGVLAAPYLLPVMCITETTTITLFMLLLPGVCFNAHSNLGYVFLQATNRFRLAALLSAAGVFLMWATFVASYSWAGLYALGFSWVLGQALYAVISDAAMLYVAGEGNGVQGRVTAFKTLVWVNIITLAVDPLSPSFIVVKSVSAGIVVMASILALIQYRNQSDILCNLPN